ncbi:MAG TPA: hypothetical protein VFP58_04250 [Candidatus Eisenbacteria bacterium]|nr:hypothetical protein [Candidatus Eisenbacteria bacterium]
MRSGAAATRSSPIVTLLEALLAASLAGSCARAPEPREPNPLEAPPVDSSRVSSPDEPLSWGYRRELGVDLDGDDRQERLVVASDVTLGPDGRPLWEDGHRWAVLVDAPQGRTLLYAAFVPNGFVEAAALAADDAGARRVLVQERTPSQLRALEVEYEGPGAAKLRSGAYYQLGTWIEGSAVMPPVR